MSFFYVYDVFVVVLFHSIQIVASAQSDAATHIKCLCRGELMQYSINILRNIVRIYSRYFPARLFEWSAVRFSLGRIGYRH